MLAHGAEIIHKFSRQNSRCWAFLRFCKTKQLIFRIMVAWKMKNRRVKLPVSAATKDNTFLAFRKQSRENNFLVILYAIFVKQLITHFGIPFASRNLLLNPLLLNIHFLQIFLCIVYDLFPVFWISFFQMFKKFLCR